ncbi:hypothetical protein GF380_05250 [Candidatus Uhrbacteria bacterium]|nr:hypothetical protein [Candidatus Uhrbacteria bacterium]MBD3284438.1 hypothetical protein [Candidatus Uhrbacteria bacterium]
MKQVDKIGIPTALLGATKLKLHVEGYGCFDNGTLMLDQRYEDQLLIQTSEHGDIDERMFQVGDTSDDMRVYFVDQGLKTYTGETR